MKTKRTVTHNSTKKNKRTMSGGKGIISTYTRRFKDRYKKFIGISENDVTKKIKKMEAWGGLIGIYKFLEVDNIKYTNAASQKVSALEKMEENIRNTTNSFNKDGYLDAIECLQKGGDNISLLNKRCVSYDVFVNGGDAVADVDTDAAVTSDVVQGDTGTTTAVTSSNETHEGLPGAVEPEQPQRGPYDPTPGNNPDDAGESGANAGDNTEADDVESGATAVADDAESGDNAEVSGANVEVADAPDAVLGSTGTGTGTGSGTGTGTGNKTESPQTGTTSISSNGSDGSDEHVGGGSKRRPKSSRRVKFSKSKKGRTTRRIVRKHRR